MLREREAELLVRTEWLDVGFDTETGALRRIANRRTGQVLTASPAAAPWRLLPQGTSWGPMDLGLPEFYKKDEILPDKFSYAEQAGVLTLSWSTSDHGVGVEVVVREGPHGRLELWPEVTVARDAIPPLLLTYPIVREPRELSPGGEADYLLFPAHTGILVRAPLAVTPLDGCYPDGYSGCSTQFMAYFREGAGGFYVGTHDPHSTWKALRFSADECSIRHEAWDLRRGAPMALDYPVVLAALSRGDWHEAAEIYRSWAFAEAPWCRALTDATPEAKRDRGGVDRNESRWLFEDVGLSIWGAPSSLDWSPWYRFYGEVAGTPLHIVSGWDWPAKRPNTLGKEGWLPPRFHRANIDAWRGHHVTPYMNDIFISSVASDFAGTWEPTLMFPYVNFTWSRFTERTMLDNPMVLEQDPEVTTNVDFFPCPAAEPFQEFHAWRDSALMELDALSGVCYDISSGNPMLWSRCWRSEHGHPPGRGRSIIEHYGAQNRRSKRATREQTGRYLVQGVETIIENLIDTIDFYVARAGAGPLGALEAWLPEPEAPPGEGREIVPLFEALYHDIGPVREDGWLTLASELGDLFYWAAARIVLQWGALLSLHYANNPPEELPRVQVRQPAELIDWDGSRVRFDSLPEFDPHKAHFAAELAAARTGVANKYLAYGRLLRPVAPSDIPSVEMDFQRKLHFAPRLDVGGRWRVPQVVFGAWLAPDGDVGLVYANVADSPLEVTVLRSLANLWPCDVAGRRVRVTAMGGSEERGTIGSDSLLSLTLSLPARRVVLVELGK